MKCKEIEMTNVIGLNAAHLKPEERKALIGRERKFRAWHPGHMEMVYFNLSKAARDQYQAGAIIDLIANSSELIMEWSGLTDPAGVDIYEGDIVLIAGYGNYLVEFPFIELYDSAAEGDICGIKGNIFNLEERES